MTPLKLVHSEEALNNLKKRIQQYIDTQEGHGQIQGYLIGVIYADSRVDYDAYGANTSICVIHKHLDARIIDMLIDEQSFED